MIISFSVLSVIQVNRPKGENHSDLVRLKPYYRISSRAILFWRDFQENNLNWFLRFRFAWFDSVTLFFAIPTRDYRNNLLNIIRQFFLDLFVNYVIIFSPIKCILSEHFVPISYVTWSALIFSLFSSEVWSPLEDMILQTFWLPLRSCRCPLWCTSLNCY